MDIAVLLGRLGKVELNYDKATPVRRSLIEAHLARLETGTVLHTADIERVLFLINDLHGVRATSTIRPGSEPGSADLVVDVAPEPLISGQLQLDNLGSRYTGAMRTNGSLVVGSPLGLGDSLSFRGMYSEDSGINFGSASYVVPLGSNGWRVGASLSNLHYKLLAREEIPPGNGSALDALAFALLILILIFIISVTLFKWVIVTYCD